MGNRKLHENISCLKKPPDLVNIKLLIVWHGGAGVVCVHGGAEGGGPQPANVLRDILHLRRDCHADNVDPQPKDVGEQILLRIGNVLVLEDLTETRGQIADGHTDDILLVLGQREGELDEQGWREVVEVTVLLVQLRVPRPLLVRNIQSCR